MCGNPSTVNSMSFSYKKISSGLTTYAEVLGSYDSALGISQGLGNQKENGNYHSRFSYKQDSLHSLKEVGGGIITVDYI